MREVGPRAKRNHMLAYISLNYGPNVEIKEETENHIKFFTEDKSVTVLCDAYGKCTEKFRMRRGCKKNVTLDIPYSTDILTQEQPTNQFLPTKKYKPLSNGDTVKMSGVEYIVLEDYGNILKVQPPTGGSTQIARSDCENINLYL